MSDDQESAGQQPAPAADKKKTSMPTVGCLMMLIGIGVPGAMGGLVLALNEEGQALTGLQRLLLVGADLLRVLVFAGLAVLIIGLIRARRAKK